MKIQFNDGVSIDTSGKLRPLKLRDGWYVVGRGMSIPVKDRAEAKQTIADFSKGPLCPWCESRNPPLPTAEHLDEAIFVHSLGTEKHVALNPLMCRDCKHVGGAEDWGLL